MAGKSPLLDFDKVATTATAPATAKDLLGAYYWFARSDRIWSRVMPFYHLLSEDGLWDALILAAKLDE